MAAALIPPASRPILADIDPDGPEGQRWRAYTMGDNGLPDIECFASTELEARRMYQMVHAWMRQPPGTSYYGAALPDLVRDGHWRLAPPRLWAAPAPAQPLNLWDRLRRLFR